METNELRLCLFEIIDLLREIRDKIVIPEQDKEGESVPEEKDNPIKKEMKEQVNKGYDVSSKSEVKE